MNDTESLAIRQASCRGEYLPIELCGLVCEYLPVFTLRSCDHVYEGCEITVDQYCIRAQFDGDNTAHEYPTEQRWDHMITDVKFHDDNIIITWADYKSRLPIGYARDPDKSLQYEIVKIDTSHARLVHSAGEPPPEKHYLLTLDVDGTHVNVGTHDNRNYQIILPQIPSSVECHGTCIVVCFQQWIGFGSHITTRQCIEIVS